MLISNKTLTTLPDFPLHINVTKSIQVGMRSIQQREDEGDDNDF